MDQALTQENINSGLTFRNFRKIAPNGFGNPYNTYPHSMAWFRDHLYVGTSRANLAYRGRWYSEDNSELLGKIWPVEIPKGLFDIDLRAEIWRYYPPTGKWSKVFTSPIVRGVDNFDVPLSIGFRSIAVFKGACDSSETLYVPTWGSHQTPQSVMLRSTDGENFEIRTHRGLGFPDPYKPRAVRALISFKDKLFAAPAIGGKRKEPNTSGFMIILVSSDPASGKWELACEPGFGNPNNHTVFQMSKFNGYLYAGTLNVNEGFQVWKTDAEGKPPYKWRKVLTRGAYRGKLNQIAMTFETFNGALYLGTAIQEGGYDPVNKVGPAAVEIIRMYPDDSWELVVGEPRLTAEGLKVPLSGLEPGFGNLFAGYLWSLRAHEGWLYAGTFDWALQLRYANIGDILTNRMYGRISYKNIESMIHRSGGCDLWRTRDGYRWYPVSQNGFNNYYNYGIRNMMSTSYGLFVGFTNPYSPNVAVKRVAGWTYEKNPKGGLEIWLGSDKYIADASKQSTVDPALRDKSRSIIIGKDAEDSSENIISQFYGDSGFRNFGFWRDDINDAFGACENLMDEIMAFIPEKKGKIIDIGCGLGETTKYLLKHFPPEAITGITTGRKHLTACRKKAPLVQFINMRSSLLTAIEAESFDLAIWVKGLFPLVDRKKLLGECLRILKPEGQLVFFDLLPVLTDKRRIWKKPLDSARPIETISDYRRLLLEAGFQGFVIEDVTTESLEKFQKHLRKYCGLKKLLGTIEEKTLDKIEAYLLMSQIPIRQCLLISGRKPGRAPERR